jgi:DNA-binding NarL/FixJ family response regulator
MAGQQWLLFSHGKARYFRGMEPITILVADAQVLFRQWLTRSLAKENICVVGEAENSSQVLSGVEALQPHILLLDIQMPKLGGIIGLLRIRAKSPRTKILFLTHSTDEEFIVRALQCGAEGCLLKTAPATELVEAIRTVYSGEIWAQRKLLTRVLEGLRQRIDELQGYPSWMEEVLTVREREVITWAVEGMTNKGIATQLGISEKTVKTHLQNVFRKLKISRRVQLPRFRLAFRPPLPIPFPEALGQDNQM